MNENSQEEYNPFNNLHDFSLDNDYKHTKNEHHNDLVMSVAKMENALAQLLAEQTDILKSHSHKWSDKQIASFSEMIERSLKKIILKEIVMLLLLEEKDAPKKKHEHHDHHKHCECKEHHYHRHCDCKELHYHKHCECKEHHHNHCECKEHHHHKHCDCKEHHHHDNDGKEDKSFHHDWYEVQYDVPFKDKHREKSHLNKCCNCHGRCKCSCKNTHDKRQVGKSCNCFSWD